MLAGEITMQQQNYNLPINQIICGDCIKVMKRIPKESIDLIVTSPPYNCGIEYDIYNDWRPIDEYYNWVREWLKECYRVLKPNRRIALNVLFNKGNKRGREQPGVAFSSALWDAGFKLNNITLWLDDHRVKYTAWGSWKSASAPYIFCPYEVIIMANKGSWKRDDKGISDITGDEFKEWVSGQWKMQPVTKRVCCPAPFPKELPKRCIKLLSYVGNIILDPFCGDGTTCIVAKEFNRKYIGIDISEKYCNYAKEQLRTLF